ncbi:MAG TPA: hypothetical protein VH062_00925 [Polyangiaceae bacterium]|nr:hypothetical protein [Polyangiaceae bacterium]
MVLAAGLLSSVYTLATLAIQYENGSLRGDDIVYFSEARRTHFLSFIGEPIDVHAVPLHRATTYLVTLFGRPDYDALLLAMTVVHVAGVVLLYRALERFAPNPGNAVATFWYATFVYLGTIFGWWTSAAHRLPYLAFFASALYAYARFRQEHRATWAACAVLSMVSAVGFFEKGALFPLILGAVEASLWFETDARDRKTNFALVAGLGALTLVYFVAWRWAVGESWSALSATPRHAVTYAVASYRMLLSASVGRVADWYLPALLLWAFLVVVTIRRAPRTALIWGGAIVVTTVSLLTTGISVARSQVWGEMLPYYSHRYYPDVMFVLMVFVALVWQRAYPSGAQALRGRRSRWLSAASALMAMTALTLVSTKSALDLQHGFYAPTREGKIYEDNVVAGMEQLKAEHRPLNFVDGTVPRHLNPMGGDGARVAILLHALGYHAHFYDLRTAKRGRGVYRITDTGELALVSSK